MGCVLEANELQPGLVPSHCYLPSIQKVTVCQCDGLAQRGAKNHTRGILYPRSIHLSNKASVTQDGWPQQEAQL